MIYQQKEECKEEETEDDTIDRNSLRLILSSVLCTLSHLAEKGSRILILTEEKKQ